MRPSLPSLRSIGRAPALLAGLAVLAMVAPARASLLQAVPDAASQAFQNQRVALASFLDQLPDLADLGLPTFAPPGAIRLYAHPKFGDLLHEDYFRLPVGARIKLRHNFEFNTELAAYFTHGLRDSVGNGLYEGRIGLKHERAFSPDSGASSGIDFITPLSRPPYDITDGIRHTLPYITVTHTVMPSCGLVGFATFGADLIDHTSLPENFRKNELRANALNLTLGLAREWRRMHVIVKVSDGNTALMSRLHQNVFGIRPSIGIPFLRREDGTPRFTGTFEGRAVWGPDGFETGVTTSVRFDLRYRRGGMEP